MIFIEGVETTHEAPAVQDEDIVRPLWRHRESSRNDCSLAISKSNNVAMLHIN